MFAEMSERDTLLSYLSDAHKDAYGCRPSQDQRERYSKMSLVELHKEADHLSEMVAIAIRDEEEIQDANAEAFEARVADALATGAGDRDTAIRWIIDSEDLAEDVAVYGTSYMEHRFGLKFGYFSPK